MPPTAPGERQPTDRDGDHRSAARDQEAACLRGEGGDEDALGTGPEYPGGEDRAEHAAAPHERRHRAIALGSGVELGRERVGRDVDDPDPHEGRHARADHQAQRPLVEDNAGAGEDTGMLGGGAAAERRPNARDEDRRDHERRRVDAEQRGRGCAQAQHYAAEQRADQVAGGARGGDERVGARDVRRRDEVRDRCRRSGLEGALGHRGDPEQDDEGRGLPGERHRGRNRCGGEIGREHDGSAVVVVSEPAGERGREDGSHDPGEERGRDPGRGAGLVVDGGNQRDVGRAAAGQRDQPAECQPSGDPHLVPSQAIHACFWPAITRRQEPPSPLQRLKRAFDAGECGPWLGAHDPEAGQHHLKGH